MNKFLDLSGHNDVTPDPTMVSKIFAASAEIHKGCKRNYSVNHIKAATFMIIAFEATFKTEATKKAKLRKAIEGFIDWENDPGNSAERELELLSYVTDMLGATVLVRSRAAEVAREVLFSFRLSGTSLEKSDAFQTKAIDVISNNTAEIVFQNAGIEIPPMPS